MLVDWRALVYHVFFFYQNWTPSTAKALLFGQYLFTFQSLVWGFHPLVSVEGRWGLPLLTKPPGSKPPKGKLNIRGLGSERASAEARSARREVHGVHGLQVLGAQQAPRTLGFFRRFNDGFSARSERAMGV